MTSPDLPSLSNRGRIWLINQWLPPDPAPTAVLCGEVINLCNSEGRELVLVSRVRGAASSPLPGVRHIIIDHLAHGPTGIVSKLVSWPSFAWRAWHALRRELRADDTVIVCSDPPLFYPLAIVAAKRVGARVIHWSQDVYPDVVERYWPSALLRLALAPLRAWRNRWLRRADAVVAISDGMAGLMQAAGARTVVIPNWARDDRIQARALGDSALRRAHYRADAFVVAYSGNLGRVHEFETLIGAALALRDDPRIKFQIVGAGPRLPQLRARVETHGLTSFRFLPLQPEAQLSDTLAAGDIHFVSLRPEFERLVLPSKFYSIAAVGRPVLFCGDPDGEMATLVRQHACGAAVAAGDVDALAGCIGQLAGDTAGCERMARAARQMIDEHYARWRALSDWARLLEQRS